MKAFWAAVARAAVRVAVYATEHPDQVVAIVNAVK